MELKSGEYYDLIEEEILAIDCDFNPYREQFPMIPVEDTLNAWCFSASAIDIYVFKMSPVISR
jgi:hypothetical protein